MPTHYHITGTTATTIAESIERALDAGRFAPGERLPTIRGLADDLDVSPTTVNGAFALLRSRGRIAGRRRGGSVVVGRVRFQSGSLSEAPPGTRSLLEANPDPAFLPALGPVIREAVVERRLYGEARESESLLSQARRRLRADGVDVDHIAIVSGAMDGVERALVAHLTAGDTIALEDPTYPPYVGLAQALRLRIIRIPLDDHGITERGLREAIRSGARAVVVIPRAQNPSGVYFDERRAAALGKVLRAAPHVLAIEDDYLSEVSGVPLFTLSRYAPRFAYIRSYAKLLGPDLRVALIAGDALTVARIRDRQRLGCGWVSHILQNTTAALLADGATDRLFARAKRTYTKRRDALLAALAARGITGYGASGLVVWVPVENEQTTVANAARAGWAIDAGARYRGDSAPGVRITISQLAPGDASGVAAAIAAPYGSAERTTAG